MVHLSALVGLLSLTLADALSVAARADGSGSSACPKGYSPGDKTFIYTVPYSYEATLALVGDFRNLTWAGVPTANVTVFGSTVGVGTTRVIDNSGQNITETIAVYSKPAHKGPFVEAHNSSLIGPPGSQFRLLYDGMTVESVCGGKAARMNFTGHFCAQNVTFAAGLMYDIYSGGVINANKLLGGKNFTSCAACGKRDSFRA